ncbi:hypothetical protein EJB05_22895, partial [Eragrostis curvula]
MTFISLASWITMPGCFFLYAGVAVAGCVFLYARLPETKGRSLEDMDVLFAAKKSSDLGGLAVLHDGLRLGVQRCELPFPMRECPGDDPDVLPEFLHLLFLRTQLPDQLKLLFGETVSLLPGPGELLLELRTFCPRFLQLLLILSNETAGLLPRLAELLINSGARRENQITCQH